MKTMIIAVLLSLAGWCFGGAAEEYSKWYEQGIDYVRQGDLDGAKLSFSMALSYKPGDANAQRGLEMSEERLKQQAALAPASVQAVPQSKSKDRGSIRVTVGSAPGADEYDVNGAVGTMSDDGGFRTEVVYVKRHLEKGDPDIGWLLGGGLFIAQHAGTDVVGDEAEVTAFGGLVQYGFAAKAGNHVAWEIDLYLGLGFSELDVPALSAVGASSSNTGVYGMGGVKAGVFYLWGDNFEVGLELGYESFASSVEVSNGFTTADLTVSGGGPRIAGVLAYTF